MRTHFDSALTSCLEVNSLRSLLAIASGSEIFSKTPPSAFHQSKRLFCSALVEIVRTFTSLTSEPGIILFNPKKEIHLL